EAANAYAQGDVMRAAQLQQQNAADLQAAMAAAPAPAASTLSAQLKSYDETKRQFAAAKPTTTAGRAAAKAAVVKDVDNLSRTGF
ncbi:MAG TPA: hypothetical protein VIF62_36605, partial [Labilithrix sp.]